MSDEKDKRDSDDDDDGIKAWEHIFYSQNTCSRFKKLCGKLSKPARGQR